MINGCPNTSFAYIERKEIYDNMGIVITNPYEEEGYDINGFPVTRIAGVIIDGEVFVF